MASGRTLDPNRPKVPELVPLLWDIYRQQSGHHGCCLHCTIEDPNYNFQYLEDAMRAEEREPGKHTACIAAARVMDRMTPTQRRKAVKLAYPGCARLRDGKEPEVGLGA